MKNTLMTVVVGVAMCTGLVSRSSFGQSIPVPEYFGVYAVVDGRLLKLDGQEVHSEKNVTVNIGQRMGVGNVVQHQPATMPPKSMQVPELPADLKIVVYAQPGGLQSPLDIAKTLHLESLVFVRTLTIDTGWPSAIKRSDPENGWDSGDAVELAVVAGGEHARELEFLMKPMAGHNDMVVAGLADKLKPGVYRLTLGQREAFMPASMQGGMLFAVQPVSQGEAQKCVDALVSYNMSMSNTKYAPCGETSSAPSTSTQTIANTSSAGVATCSDYDSCFQAGITAYKSKDWAGAKAAFQAAANQRPTSGEPWMWLGRILFQDNQPHQLADLSNVWDKALSLGTELMLGACHERSFQPCQRGDLALSIRRISFLANGSQSVFSAAPADVTPGRIFNNSAGAHISYSMRVTNKNYAIDFIPLGTVCQFNLMVQCPPDGIAKQLIMAQYVSETLPKLSHGALTATLAPSTPNNGTPTTPTTSTANSGCNQAADAGYAILLQGHLYKVRLEGSLGPEQKPFFFDEKGKQVMEPTLLTQLAAAVWTHDNVIASPDARNGSTRVSGILGTSKAMQTYTTVQDLIARSMVEAIQAGLTGGASLSKAVPNLTLSVLKTQLLNAPKTLLTLAAQHGLQASLAAYQQMQAVPLPPQDATAFNATDLARIRTLYIQARSLELPYAALAAKLMPISGSDLTQQALKSAFNELTVGPLFSSVPSTVVTLQSLFQLQQSVSNLATSLPALQTYSQDLNLAINLTSANDETISKWASSAAHTCS